VGFNFKETSPVYSKIGFAMSRFQFEKSKFPEEQDWSLGAKDTRNPLALGRGPRLVGGTSFIKQAGFGPDQVQLLSKAAIHSMAETRKVLTKWRQQGRSLTDIYLQGIAPSARLIGELWSADELDFANGSIAYSHLHMALLEFSSEFLSEGRSDANGSSLLLMTEPGSQHGLGALMLGEFFRQSGWRVLCASPQDIDDFKRLFLSDWFDAVVLSISTDRQIDPIAKAMEDLRPVSVNPHLRIFVGGPMARIAPERLNWTGTVLLQTDAAQTVEIVTQAIGKTSPTSSPASCPIG
jgi:methanogenic corrinoid protein MtbC1